MRLSEIKQNTKIKVININLNNKTKHYLESLGLTINTKIKLIKKSIFKGPLIIFIKNYYLCISNDIAKNIIVDKI